MSRVSIAILILIIIGFIMTIQRDGPSVITGDPSATVVTTDNGKKGGQSDETTKPDRAKSDVISAPSNLPFGAAKSAAEAAAQNATTAERAKRQTEPDMGSIQKQSVATVDQDHTGETREEANDTTNAASSISPQEIHHTPRVEKPRQKSTHRRARSRRRDHNKKSARMKRRRRSAARWRQKWADPEPYRRRHPRYDVWEGDWEPRQSGMGR